MTLFFENGKYKKKEKKKNKLSTEHFQMNIQNEQK